MDDDDNDDEIIYKKNTDRQKQKRKSQWHTNDLFEAKTNFFFTKT